MKKLKHVLLERLMHYYHFVVERQDAADGATVTSTQIAKLVHMDATLVRKDLAAIGVRGYPHVGFRSHEVVQAIRDALGFDEPHRAAIIGAGRLGQAIASYHGFTPYGVDIVALFDIAPQKTGLIVGRHEILPLASLARVVAEQNISIVILTVPASAAQEVADQAVATGVRAIWNFATTGLVVPDGVFVRHEHISVGLAELSYHLKQNAS